MRRKDKERALARELRAQGWSLRKIAQELDVALSSVSVWVRDPGVVKVVPRMGPGDALSIKSISLVSDVVALRRCGKCRRGMALTNFGRHPNGHQWWCKDCFRAYFAARGQLHRDQTQKALRQRRIDSRMLVKDRLNSGCVDCGTRDPLVLEFDHVGEKTADISRLIRTGVAPRRVKKELEACEVVCVNCHRLRTYDRAGTCWRLSPDSLETSPNLARGERRNLIHLRDHLLRSTCTDCGTAELLLLEFDHRSGKSGLVTKMAREGCSLARLKQEVAKCDVRCASCHRRRTISELRASRAAA